MNRVQQKAHTLAQLRRSSRHVLAARGFHAARTLDVAKAANVAHGTLFVHYANRNVWIIDVIKDFTRDITDAMHAMALEDDGLLGVLQSQLKVLTKHENLYARLLTEVSTLPKKARSAWLGLQAAMSHHLGVALEREQAAGRLKPIPLHLAFHTWIGLLHHYLANRDLFAPTGSVLTKHGAKLLQFYFSLLHHQGTTDVSKMH